eukprot:CAMPEP_0115022766 /NCGR_PEP_ID=MMETSP0216-20121206/31807_1 /TAXON_ID=223996 /ORGANISM="Protocruzia adherens, Strain Boccale" /LENGTH=128 /DNA_ID=CAMNT_0002395635 /DNA_START=9 /DNA_END=395 /DNA_ORIENTATION=+
MFGRGGGVCYIPKFERPAAHMFRAGLRIPKANYSWFDTHHPMGFDSIAREEAHEKGYIVHQRSSNNVKLGYGVMHGGIKAQAERWIVQGFWNKFMKRFWLAYIVFMTWGNIGYWAYDTGAYEYFYFTD